MVVGDRTTELTINRSIDGEGTRHYEEELRLPSEAAVASIHHIAEKVHIPRNSALSDTEVFFWETHSRLRGKKLKWPTAAYLGGDDLALPVCTFSVPPPQRRAPAPPLPRTILAEGVIPVPAATFLPRRGSVLPI